MGIRARASASFKLAEVSRYWPTSIYIEWYLVDKQVVIPALRTYRLFSKNAFQKGERSRMHVPFKKFD